MTVLVTGATGKQGGATARALIEAGIGVRALVRDPAAERARALADLGADLVRGDLNDTASLRAAADGVRGVFSVQIADLDNLTGDGEVVRGRNLVAAARAAGVEQFVHTSVAGSGGDYSQESDWVRHYWESKAAIDDAVRDAGFRHWTVLKPSTFMENLIGWSYLFGNWMETGFLTAYAETTELPLIAVDDIGRAAAAAFADPGGWHGRDVLLAAERLTMTQIAGVLSDVLGRPVDAPVLTVDEAIARGVSPEMAAQQNLPPQPGAPDDAYALGLKLEDLRSWAARHLA
jgi:uncharacterized protein YbjT (DUF2867 family)